MTKNTNIEVKHKAGKLFPYGDTIVPDISLCPHCYCATHTLNGKCGKCKKDKTNHSGSDDGSIPSVPVKRGLSLMEKGKEVVLPSPEYCRNNPIQIMEELKKEEKYYVDLYNDSQNHYYSVKSLNYKRVRIDQAIICFKNELKFYENNFGYVQFEGDNEFLIDLFTPELKYSKAIESRISQLNKAIALGEKDGN